MTKKLTLVFFGNEKLATGLPTAKPIIKDALVKAGFEIEQIVTDPLSSLRPHASQLAVLAAYGHIIPQKILDEFPLGIINVHPSLLPRYRGPTPIESTILDGATRTGVSIMQLTAGMDEGPVYKQKTLHLTGKETKAELTENLQSIGAQLLVEVLPHIADSRLKPRQQPHADRDTTYSRKITKQDGLVDWRKPAEQIVREIRAYAGWPKSQTNLFETDMVITQASCSTGWGGEPGTVAVYLAEGVIKVQCKYSSLVLERLLPAGRKEVSTKEFINGHKNKILMTEAIEIH